MINYWIMGEYFLLICMLICGVLLTKDVLRFMHALAMQVSFYVVASKSDENIRAAQYSEILVEHVKIREKSVKHILYSTLGIAVIIFLRYVLEVAHANV
ncbi:hypothetical protein DEEACLCL_00140 [Salmonella phage CRW-SP2]|nr:hypothetical protein DEEACLCL_00140 [Salmonella phage CRW-SP2]